MTEDTWDKLFRELTVAFGHKTPDELRWVLGYIADEIAYHDSKACEWPDSYRYLLTARDAAVAELESRARANAAA
jgi:hypothetical protein